MAIDCMLRKKEEKKNKVKDEAYYSKMLGELKKSRKIFHLWLEEKMKMRESIKYGHRGLMMKR